MQASVIEALGRNDPKEDLINFADYFNTPLWPKIHISDPAVLNHKVSAEDTVKQGTEIRKKKDRKHFHSNDLLGVVNEDEVRRVLQEDGVDISNFGVGKAKTLKALVGEIRESSSFLERDTKTGRIQRVVEPVFIQLRYKNLVLVEGLQTLEDGRTRMRNMFLAEKKDSHDGGVAKTGFRGVCEELGLAESDLMVPGRLKFREDRYCFEVEKLDSASYPGLPCIYRTHYVQIDILEAGLFLFEKFNLPAGGDFVTYETGSLGTKTHNWRWQDVESARREKIKKFPPRSDQDEETAESAVLVPAGVDELRTLLEDSQVDTSTWGVGKAKTVAQLLKELKEGSSILERNPETGNVQRVVEPVFIKLKWKNLVLIELEQEMEDGRKRERNMLIAEKKDPSDENVFATCVRGLHEELLIPLEEMRVAGRLRYRQDLYCCRAEHMTSASYPALPCVYRTHYAQVDILEDGLQIFQNLGLPDGTQFETVEKGKKIIWSWMDTTAAADKKIKGYLQAMGKEGANLVVKEPETIEALATLLKDDGITIQAWGVGKAKTVAALFEEITSGNCLLERSPKTCRLVRVVEPAFIAFKWQGQELVQAADDLEEDAVLEKRRKSIAGKFDQDSSEAACALKKRQSVVVAENDSSPGKVVFREDLNCFEVENYESVVYPELQCVYRTKHVRLVQSGERQEDHE